jgi:hypothetical protein
METLGSQLSRYGAISNPLPVAPTGKIFFVLASTATYLGDFMSEFTNDKDGVPRIYTTINAAMAACVANRGDVIYVLPGHVENITSATTLVCNKAGVRIQGVGEGTNRPTLTWTTSAAATIPVSAANVTIDNMILTLTGVAAVTAGITPTAAGFTLSNSTVNTASATNQAALGILTTAAANSMTIVNNRFLGTPNAGTAAAIRVVGGANLSVRNNVFLGNYTTTLGAIDNATTACTLAHIENNFIYNATAASTVALNFQAASTGIISNNRMQILSGTAPIVGAAMSWVGANYYAATIATAGTLI